MNHIAAIIGSVLLAASFPAYWFGFARQSDKLMSLATALASFGVGSILYALI